jgi:hypothetical protein
MSVLAAVPTTASPLSKLPIDERATVIATISAQLAPNEALPVLTALAGQPEEVAALPLALRQHARDALWITFPTGVNVVVLSALGLAALERGGDWTNEARDELERLPSWEAAMARIHSDLRAAVKERRFED